MLSRGIKIQSLSSCLLFHTPCCTVYLSKVRKASLWKRQRERAERVWRQKFCVYLSWGESKSAIRLMLDIEIHLSALFRTETWQIPLLSFICSWIHQVYIRKTEHCPTCHRNTFICNARIYYWTWQLQWSKFRKGKHAAVNFFFLINGISDSHNDIFTENVCMNPEHFIRKISISSF